MQTLHLIDSSLYIFRAWHSLPDEFQDHDKPEVMYAKAGLDAEGIVRATLRALGIETTGVGAARA